MATESPKERSDDAAVTSSPKLTNQIDSDSQNADLERPRVNGSDKDATAAPPAAAPTPDEPENKHISDIVDDLVHSTEVSISGGSDNEAAKSKDAKGRAASATKKPASFKAINVNKMFLATKATSAAGAQTKTADKSPSLASATPAASGTATTSRPRLVAKTGGGLITKGASGAKAAPDPSAVWNKNRPTPPPEPKKYTDEELRKYGIHMAARLQTSDNKGQSNWADIEDDDDDWGPDTITWKDGTKVQIAPLEHFKTDHAKTESAANKDKADADKAKTTSAAAPTATTTTATTATTVTTTATTAAAAAVAPAKPGTLSSGKGLVLKGAAEKPTLVAKPPAPPAPAKSPWAPLPKIDKVSPVAPEAAAAQVGPRSSPSIAPAHPSPGPLPPREIAADDFSRAAWRDGPPSGNRELFNSHSGRYEPVHDRRGPPMRGDGSSYGRQPALMQRPPHHEQLGPPDHHRGPFMGRDHEHPGSYGRRRTSSNTSTGSGGWQRPTFRTLEHPPPPPELIARRASTAAGSEGPMSPRISQAGSQGSGPRHGGQAWQPRTSPGTAHATPYHHQQQQQPPLAPENRGMPPPLHPSPGAPPAVVVTEDDYELQKRLMRERRELALKRRQEEEAREEAARRERIRQKLEALGPPPETSKSKKATEAADKSKEQPGPGPSPTQIQSRERSTDKAAPTDSKAAAADKPAAAEAATATNSTKQQQQQPQQPQQQPSAPGGVAATSNLPPTERVESQGQAQAGAQQAPSQQTQTQNPSAAWVPPSRQTDRHAPVWGPQPSSKNVWAPPHNRSLGNGTFSSDIGAAPLPPSGPGPIAPPNRSASNQANMASSTAARQQPIGPPRQPQAARSVGERDMPENPWAAAVRRDDEKYADMVISQYEERDRRLKAEGRSVHDAQPAIKDTWRPTKLNESGARTAAAPKQTLHIGQENPWTASAEAKTGVQQGSTAGAAPDYGQLAQGPVSAARGGSRFFPARQDNRDARPEPAPEPIRRSSPSPPPPDMAGHPAFDGDASHPHVSLPRPHPVVRLPPSAANESHKSAPEPRPGDPPKSHGAPSFSWAAQAPYKDADNAQRGPAAAKTDSVWQAKIDNLLGGRKVPQPRHATAAAAAAAAADHRAPHNAAPPEPSAPAPAPAVQPAEAIGSVTTKVMDEECFEEQEMGSVPPIRLPKTVPEMAWQPSPSPKPLSKKFYPIVVSADPISFPIDVSGAGTVWRVRLPGLEVKNITVPFGRTRSNPRRSGPRGSRQGPSNQHRGKGRESSAAFSGDQGSSASGTTGSHGRSHRSGYRSRDNWSRNGNQHSTA
ncbi:hypothetical protein VTJ83DRAFT_4158 [Remersonia thermophila]|uniref:Uncharacterized protein n=1 Tax=Remersonia thermophila TaxID=72144 RepID=A0ABR4D972_9PEZI